MRNLLLLFTIALFSTNLTAQEFSKLDVSPLDIAAYPKSYKNPEKIIKVVYSRPQLKGRSIDSLAKKGKVWRTGANETTEITFYKPVILGNKKIAPGTYSLFTIPGDNEWAIIINSDTNTWGSYFYNKEHDIVRVTVPVTKAKDSLEAFSIAFTEDDNGKIIMHLGWGNTRVAVPFEKK